MELILLYAFFILVVFAVVYFYLPRIGNGKFYTGMKHADGGGQKTAAENTMKKISNFANTTEQDRLVKLGNEY